MLLQKLRPLLKCIMRSSSRVCGTLLIVNIAFGCTVHIEIFPRYYRKSSTVVKIVIRSGSDAVLVEYFGRVDLNSTGLVSKHLIMMSQLYFYVSK